MPGDFAQVAITHGSVTMKTVDLGGWGSPFILLGTLMRQVYTQWRTRATAGVSKWLFIGQCSASVGYVIHSFVLHNWVYVSSNVAILVTAWVYVSSNVAILVTAFVGEGLYFRNRRRVGTDSKQQPLPTSAVG